MTEEARPFFEEGRRIVNNCEWEWNRPEADFQKMPERLAEAIEALDEAEKRCTFGAEIYATRARARLMRFEYDEAERDLTAAVKWDRKHDAALQQLRPLIAARRARNQGWTVPTAEPGVAEGAHDVEFLTRRGVANRDAADFREVLRIKKNDDFANEMLGALELQGGADRNAYVRGLNATNLALAGERTGRRLLQRARLHRKLGMEVEAKRDYDLALTFEPPADARAKIEEERRSGAEP